MIVINLNLYSEKIPEEPTEKFDYYFNLADSIQADNPILAEENNFEALKIAKELNDSLKIAKSSYLMGVIYYYLGKSEWAIEHLTKALDINEKLRDSSKMANCYTVIGIVYDLQEKYKSAIDFYTKALQHYQSVNDTSGIAASLGNIGLSYYYLKDYNKSFDYLDKSLKKNKLLDDKVSISINLGNLGNIYYDQRNFDKALEYYYQAKEISESADDKNGISRNLINIGTAYTGKGNYKEAKVSLLMGLDIANDIGFVDGKFSAYEYLAKIDSATNNFSSAFSWQRKYYEIKDSIFSREVLTKIAQLEEKENIRDRKEEARIQLEIENRRNNVQYFGVFIILIFLFVFVFMTGKIKMHVRIAEGLIFFTFILQ